MKAMILAAGLGTRLRPLTDTRPKALIEVGGRTLLEITLSRLRDSGISEVIINAHHFAGMILNYLRANNNFGMRVEVSREDILLDTGGGLKKAAWFFLENSGDGGQPFILHNVDVISGIDLHRMTRFHQERGGLATLAVQERKTARDLIFDSRFQLVDHRQGGLPISGGAAARQQALSFCGIHVISPRLFSLLPKERIFSIINSYLDLAGMGEKIFAFRADEYYWLDVGKLESVRQADEHLKPPAV